MQSEYVAPGGPGGEYPPPVEAADDLVAAHARNLQRAAVEDLARQSTALANPVRVGLLAATLLREFGQALLNDLLIMSEPLPAQVREPWAMARLVEALMDAADALEAAGPPAIRQRMAATLQICRVDLEWQCRAALGLPSPTGGVGLFNSGGFG